MDYRFYASSATDVNDLGSAAGTTVELWRPGVLTWRPQGVPAVPFLVWTLFHHVRLFANRHYALLLIREPSGRVVHRSCVFPRYFRFPFMGKADLQIGDTWTAEDMRGRGLARLAIQQVVQRLAQPGRVFWYIVEDDNAASIRAAERAGLQLAGRGRRVARAGLRILGQFRLEQHVQQDASRRPCT